AFAVASQHARRDILAEELSRRAQLQGNDFAVPASAGADFKDPLPGLEPKQINHSPANLGFVFAERRKGQGKILIVGIDAAVVERADVLVRSCQLLGPDQIWHALINWKAIAGG